MTLELNLRAVTNQAERLERDVKTLVLSTADDKVFRAANETRMESIYREITAVKQRMEEHRTDKTNLKQMYEETVDGLRTEMVNMKSSLEDLSEVLNTLPSIYSPRGVRSKSDAPAQSATQKLAIRSSTSRLQGSGHEANAYIRNSTEPRRPYPRSTQLDTPLEPRV